MHVSWTVDVTVTFCYTSPPPSHMSIAEKYKFRREIGRGAYGSVWSAKEIATQTDVAIKKIGARNFDETMLAKRALRELKLLRHLNGHDNVLFGLYRYWLV